MSKKKNHDTYLNLEILLKNTNHHLTMQDATITNWEAHTHTHTHTHTQARYAWQEMQV